MIDDLTRELMEAVVGEFGLSSGRRQGSGLKEVLICFQGEVSPGVISEFELLKEIPSLNKLKVIQQSEAPRKVEGCQRFALVHFTPNLRYNLLSLSLDIPNLCLPPVLLAEFLLSLPLQLVELSLPSIVLKCNKLFLEDVLPKRTDLRKLQLFHSHGLSE